MVLIIHPCPSVSYPALVKGTLVFGSWEALEKGNGKQVIPRDHFSSSGYRCPSLYSNTILRLDSGKRCREIICVDWNDAQPKFLSLCVNINNSEWKFNEIREIIQHEYIKCFDIAIPMHVQTTINLFTHKHIFALTNIPFKMNWSSYLTQLFLP